jgi:benzodiazapine receptor
MPPKSSSRSSVQIFFGLVGFLLLCAVIAQIGAHAVVNHVYWYSRLVKPRFTPPNGLFVPGWTVFYGLMAVAAWLIWRAPRRRTRSKYYSTYSNDDSQGAARQDALTVFYIQLGLGLLWTEMFFHFHRFLVSSVVILALWCAIVCTIFLFWRVRPVAAWLLVPCLACVTYATALNLAFLRLN